MILSDNTIRQLCNIKQQPLIEPFVERKLHKGTGTSYGLGPSSYDVRLNQCIKVLPGRITLGSTMEKVIMPSNVCANIRDKSTLIRRGLHVFNTHIDPGFIGYVTIEITNYTDDVVILKKGSPVCQFVFELLDKPAAKPYAGKYQNQPNRPVEAIDEVISNEERERV